MDSGSACSLHHRGDLLGFFQGDSIGYPEFSGLYTVLCENG
jgi:hypothetical protein